MSRASILLALKSALQAFELTEHEERSVCAELEECIDTKLSTACESLHCEARLDSVAQQRLIGSESLASLSLTFHIAPMTAANGFTYKAPVVGDVRQRLVEAAASVASYCGESADYVSVQSVDWSRDQFVANVTWVLTHEGVNTLVALNDIKTEDTVKRIKEDAEGNASRYELESELVRFEMAEQTERLNKAIAARTRSHGTNRSEGGRRGLRSYKKPARRFAQRSQTHGKSKSAKPISRVRVPRLGGAANLKPFVESGRRMRAARSARRTAEGGIKALLSRAVRTAASALGLASLPVDEREWHRESERVADYVAAHSADDDLFVY